jgi:hypothetical protein
MVQLLQGKLSLMPLCWRGVPSKRLQLLLLMILLLAARGPVSSLQVARRDAKRGI